MKNYNFKLVYKKHNKKSWILPSVIWSLLIGLVITMIFGYFLGYRIFTVLGYSSEPDIHYGSIVVDFKVPFDELKVGDYVTWTRGGKTYVTHQIIEIASKDYIVTSQTDYFAEPGETVNPDDPIKYENIQGKVILSVPYVGDIIYGIRNMVVVNGQLNILGLMTIVLVITAYYFFKRLLYVETYTLKEY